MKIKIILKETIDPKIEQDVILARQGYEDSRQAVRQYAKRKNGKSLPVEIVDIFEKFMEEHNLNDFSQIRKNEDYVFLFSDLARILNIEYDFTKIAGIFKQLFNTYLKYLDLNDKSEFMWNVINKYRLSRVPYNSKIKAFYRKNMIANHKDAYFFAKDIDRRYHPDTFNVILKEYLGYRDEYYMKNYLRYFEDQIPEQFLERVPVYDVYQDAFLGSRQ